MLIENATGMTVIAEAGSREEAIAAVANEQPDIVLLDLDMGQGSSLDFLGDLLAASSNPRVVVLTGLRDPESHRRAVRLGALGLVSKEQAPEVLIKAIRKVAAGEAWLDPSLTAAVLGEMTRSTKKKDVDPESAKISTLTRREQEIIALVCDGSKNKEIAARLFISNATVRNHMTSILSKLDLTDRLDLALYSFRHGLAKPPG
jgi:DNA-binding NarL/FixJ family response regulator